MPINNKINPLAKLINMHPTRQVPQLNIRANLGPILSEIIGNKIKNNNFNKF